MQTCLLIQQFSIQIKSTKYLKIERVFFKASITYAIATTLNLQVGGQLFRAPMNTFANSDNTNAPSSFMQLST